MFKTIEAIIGTDLFALLALSTTVVIFLSFLVGCAMICYEDLNAKIRKRD